MSSARKRGPMLTLTVATWIPAFAGMTDCWRGSGDPASLSVRRWIPACARLLARMREPTGFACTTLDSRFRGNDGLLPQKQGSVFVCTTLDSRFRGIDGLLARMRGCSVFAGPTMDSRFHDTEGSHVRMRNSLCCDHWPGRLCCDHWSEGSEKRSQRRKQAYWV
jgi:hypothetical protein